MRIDTKIYYPPPDPRRPTRDEADHIVVEFVAPDPDFPHRATEAEVKAVEKELKSMAREFAEAVNTVGQAGAGPSVVRQQAFARSLNSATASVASLNLVDPGHLAHGKPYAIADVSIRFPAGTLPAHNTNWGVDIRRAISDLLTALFGSR
jgi:hypothetical protein